jgi:hypothetical protein
MAWRKYFRVLERPVSSDLTANDVWCNPDGHSASFAYSFFNGGWGEWKYVHVSLSGPKQWVFVPFLDETVLLGAGRMIYKQHHQPAGAKTGSAWVCPKGTFKRVLSRGGAWENLNIGSTHHDEVDHAAEEFQRAEAQQQQHSPEVPSGAGQLSSRDGNNGEMPGDGQQQREENSGLIVSEGGGVDETSPPVV